MKRPLHRAAIPLGLVLFLAAILFGALYLASGDDPSGRYAGFKFSRHWGDEVIYFERGRVRLVTCCGNRDLGTYARDASGQWIWTYPAQRDPLMPHVISATILYRVKYVDTKPARYALQCDWSQLTVRMLDTPAPYSVSLQRRWKIWDFEI